MIADGTAALMVVGHVVRAVHHMRNAMFLQQRQVGCSSLVTHIEHSSGFRMLPQRIHGIVVSTSDH